MLFLPSMFVRTIALLAVCGSVAHGQSAAESVGEPVPVQPDAARPPKAEDRTIPLPQAVMGLDVDEHVGLPLPMELQFTNSDGKLVQIGDYFKTNKPAVIAMVYYKCP
ncbi:MAG: hypothetical protein NTV94_16495, partial [Planctomycetota bacterium]|nr:hypothetical protein [Planctomycetota bacterium]